MRTAIATISYLAILGIALPTAAATWYVERDGSGDFTVIQDAVDAASPGDVIMVGPGRYDEFQVHNTDWNVYVHIETEDLTIIGSGPESTIIGPVDNSVNVYNTIGFFVDNITQCRLEGVTIENIRKFTVDVIDGGVEISDCVFRDGYQGVFGTYVYGLSVQDCEFVNFTGNGITVFSSASWAEITSCTFTNNRSGFSVNSSSPQGIIVSDCVFEGGVAGGGFSIGSTGGVHNCTFTGQHSWGMWFHMSGAVEIVGNYIDLDEGWCLWIESSGLFSGHDNVLKSNSNCILVRTPVPIDFHNNHFLRGPDGWFVRTGDYYPWDPAYVDLTQNWWGTTDLDEIAEWIYDGNDHENVNLYIEYEPILGGPVPTEQTTWSDLKALYR